MAFQLLQEINLKIRFDHNKRLLVDMKLHLYSAEERSGLFFKKIEFKSFSKVEGRTFTDCSINNIASKSFYRTKNIPDMIHNLKKTLPSPFSNNDENCSYNMKILKTADTIKLDIYQMIFYKKAFQQYLTVFVNITDSRRLSKDISLQFKLKLLQIELESMVFHLHNDTEELLRDKSCKLNSNWQESVVFTPTFQRKREDLCNESDKEVLARVIRGLMNTMSVYRMFLFQASSKKENQSHQE